VPKDEWVETGFWNRGGESGKVRREEGRWLHFVLRPRAKGGGARRDKKTWLGEEIKGWGRGQQESYLKLYSNKECSVTRLPEKPKKGHVY
jgi:hypothetical protein